MPFSKYSCMSLDAFLNNSSLVLNRFRCNRNVACESFNVLQKCLKQLAIGTLSYLSIELSVDASLKRRLAGAHFSYELLESDDY